MTATIGHIERLGRRGSLELLGTQHVGRLALSVGALPTVLPVRYLVDGQDLLVGVSAEEPARRAVSGSVVAFEADCLDEGGPSWSVVVRGVPQAVPADEAADVRARLHPAGTPPDVEILRLPTGLIDGRRGERLV